MSSRLAGISSRDVPGHADEITRDVAGSGGRQQVVKRSALASASAGQVFATCRRGDEFLSGQDGHAVSHQASEIVPARARARAATRPVDQNHKLPPFWPPLSPLPSPPSPSPFRAFLREQTLSRNLEKSAAKKKRTSSTALFFFFPDTRLSDHFGSQNSKLIANSICRVINHSRVSCFPSRGCHR